MDSENTSKPILVTGASGFIASWIVKQLLDRGTTVHGTVRDKSKKEKTAHLEEVAANSPGTLHLFEADLLNKGSFKEAMQGCGIVMHTASPFFVQGIKNARKELIEPALEGTRNVLQSVNETDSVQRVVLTSSVAAMYGDATDVAEKGGVLTEEMWNETSSEKHQPYSYSKTIAEKEAWKMQKAQNRWDMTTINPAFVMGPALSHNSKSGSLALMDQLMDGSLKTGVPEMRFGIVDVRDVAQAHVEAAFRPGASGRHIVSSHDSMSMLDMANAIREKYGDKYKLPKSQLPKFMFYLIGPFIGFSWKYVSRNVGINIKFDNSKAKKELGIEFRDPVKAIQSHATAMVEAGVV